MDQLKKNKPEIKDLLARDSVGIANMFLKPQIGIDNNLDMNDNKDKSDNFSNNLNKALENDDNSNGKFS